jgi:hypothetical protein
MSPWFNRTMKNLISCNLDNILLIQHKSYNMFFLFNFIRVNGRLKTFFLTLSTIWLQYNKSLKNIQLTISWKSIIQIIWEIIMKSLYEIFLKVYQTEWTDSASPAKFTLNDHLYLLLENLTLFDLLFHTWWYSNNCLIIVKIIRN